MKPVRGYGDTGMGQLHYRRWGSGGRVLVCLAPVPYGGRYFDVLAAACAEDDLTLVCPDLPGYGNSDPLLEPSIVGYAECVARGLGLEQFEVLGFHTGCLVGLALAASAGVTRLHLIDAPAYPPADAADKLAGVSGERVFTRELETLTDAWRFSVSRHGEAIDIERGLSLFADDLQSGAQQAAGFRAAFACDVAALVQALPDRPLNLVATQGPLLDATRYLRDLIGADRVSYEEWLDVKGLVFDQHAERVRDGLLLSSA